MQQKLNNSLDHLFIAAHPDDCEIFCAGTILHFINKGDKVGICDLTRGEMASYGSVEIRQQEVKNANQLMKIHARENLSLPDSYLNNNSEMIDKVIEVIRLYRPRNIFTFVNNCRHPDHSKTHLIVKDAFFLAGLSKRKTKQKIQKKELNSHRAKNLFFFGDFNSFKKPDFVIDISNYWQQKIEIIKCFNSQILTEESNEKSQNTFVHSKKFWDYLEINAKQMGMLINKDYGEGFFCDNSLKIENL